MDEFWIGLIGQTAILIVTIVAAMLKTDRRITTVETKVNFLEDKAVQNQIDHEHVRDQIRDLSVYVAKMDGEQERFRGRSV